MRTNSSASLAGGGRAARGSSWADIKSKGAGLAGSLGSKLSGKPGAAGTVSADETDGWGVFGGDDGAAIPQTASQVALQKAEAQEAKSAKSMSAKAKRGSVMLASTMGSIGKAAKEQATVVAGQLKQGVGGTNGSLGAGGAKKVSFDGGAGGGDGKKGMRGRMQRMSSAVSLGFSRPKSNSTLGAVGEGENEEDDKL